jgi:GWxTD domain-containing protein
MMNGYGASETDPAKPARRARGRASLLAHFALCVAAVLGALGVLAPGADAQNVPLPVFDADVVAVLDAETDAPRLDIYTRIAYTDLRFTTSPQGFTARYEIAADLYEVGEEGRPGNLVENPIYERAVSVVSYGETQRGDRYDKTTHSVALEPGRYLVQLHLQDLETRESYVIERLASVPDFAGTMSLSDLVLLDGYDAEDRSIAPRASLGVPAGAPVLAFFYEVYSDRAQMVEVTRSLVRTRKGPGRVARFLGLGSGDQSEGGEVAYTSAAPARVTAGRTQSILELPTTGLEAGEYVVRVAVHSAETGELLASRERGVTLTWGGLQTQIQDLDEAVAQLRYIAKDEELDHIREARTQSERWERFNAFWKKRDPTPSTARNEKMEEYYYRVAFANERYSRYRDGWQTDQGHVTVLYGEPDHVDRHPYNYGDKPYEVWYYVRIGRKFVFVDKTGLGDYELLVPIWDEGTRIR